MKNYRESLRTNSSINNGIIEINFVPAGEGDPHGFDKVLGIEDLPDNFGVKTSIESHYTATLIINDKVVATATGHTRNTAIANCYGEYAKMMAIADLDRAEFEDAVMETAVEARRKSERLEIH